MRFLRLHEAVSATHGRACPCCGTGMRWKGRFKRPGAIQPGDMATRAHDRPVAHGGDPDVWVWACLRCNNEQGVLDFVAWARKLVRSSDRRAERVVALAVVVRTWVSNNRKGDCTSWKT